MAYDFHFINPPSS